MSDTEPIPRTIEWVDPDRVRLIDQRQLPGDLVQVETGSIDELCDLIRDLAVRGAPALGAAGAMGVALGATHGQPIDEVADEMSAARPTAVNLAWGARRAAASEDPVAEAQAIAEEDVVTNRRIGAHGAELVPAGGRVLTICNAGSLACVGYGTALGVVRAAHEAGRSPSVWVPETRPVLQGARLTAWELTRLGIPFQLVVDGRAAALMADGRVDVVVVGADRIAANGDVANKVGTFALAVAAHHHGIPFYVAAPMSTIDPDTPDGASIPIEQRAADEVRAFGGAPTSPTDAPVDNAAFDVTPASLVTGVITEHGVQYPPFSM